MKPLSIFISLLASILLLSCEKESKPVTVIDAYELNIVNPYDYTSLDEGGIEINGILENPWNNEKYPIEKDLKAIWESNIDGVLHKSPVEDPEHISFTLTELSPGEHIIYLSVKNGNNKVLKDSVHIYNAVRLIEATPHDNNNVKLKWLPNNDPDFLSYELYRSYSDYVGNNLDLIETITDPLVTEFTVYDSPLGKNMNYRVKVNFKNKPEGYYSNVLEAIYGETLDLDFTISKVIVDPNKPLIYAIVKKSNKPNIDDYGVVIINTETKLIEKHLFKDIRFRDMEITDDGQFLYLNSRSHIIYEVNLDAQDLEKAFPVGHIVDNIALGADNSLFYLIHYTSSNGDGIRKYNLSTNSLVSFQTTMTPAQQSFSNGTFIVDENNVIFYGESSSSGTIKKISTYSNVFELEDEWNAYYDGPSKMFYSKNHIYWNHFKIDKSFNIKGTYKDPNDYEMRLESISPNGKRSTAWRYVINNETQEIINRVNVVTDFGVFLNNEDMIFVDNDNPLTDEHYCTLYFYSIK